MYEEITIPTMITELGGITYQFTGNISFGIFGMCIYPGETK